MTLATYVVLVEHIEEITKSPIDDRLKIRAIETLIRSVRDDERESDE